MQYTYEFEMWRGEFGWIAEAFGIDAITQGDDVDDLCESAADVLRELVRDHLMSGKRLPKPRFDNEMQHDGIPLVVSVEVSMDEIARMSASDAARELGISPARITALISSGLLDGWREGRNTWVTVASVEARKLDAHPAGRPRKASMS